MGLLGVNFFAVYYHGKYNFTECYRLVVADYHLIFTDIIDNQNAFCFAVEVVFYFSFLFFLIF